MYPPATLKHAEQLVAALKASGRTITVAESCTGGMLGGLITSVSGASEVFHQGVITYSNEIKTSLLGVGEELLETHGAVSAEVAEAMAIGALKSAGADIALSITGIAGPGGGTDEKPVGLVYIGCAMEGKIASTENLLNGNREQVRLQSCAKAIEIALSVS